MTLLLIGAFAFILFAAVYIWAAREQKKIHRAQAQTGDIFPATRETPVPHSR
jgi:hypothetical protein